MNVRFSDAMPYKRGRKYAGAVARMRFRSSSGVAPSKRRRYNTRGPGGRFVAARALAGVRRLTRMIETKEQTMSTQVNVALPHNNLYVILDYGGSVFNPFKLDQGVSDGMAVNGGQRVGDSIALKGIMIRAFFENALARSKVYYRFMLVKMAKGDTLTRATLFKGDTNNKMIDQVNTERFTIIAQKTFNIYGKGESSANSASAAGVPLEAPTIAGDYVGGIGSRTLKMWVPGRKFGRQGVLQYENNSPIQLKFFDYRLCIVAYDWWGTPQDVNNVGRINELYTKIYYKDA